MLLDNGADVNAKSSYGYLPLHFAALHGKSKIVEALLKHGSRKDEKTITIDGGRTPLDLALFHKRNDYQDVVALLENN